MLRIFTSHWVLIGMNIWLPFYRCHIVLNTIYRFYSSPIANNRKTDHTIQLWLHLILINFDTLNWTYFIFQFPEILSFSFSTNLFQPLDRALAYKAPSAPSSPPQPGQEEVRHAASLNSWIVLDIFLNRFCWELIRFRWSHEVIHFSCKFFQLQPWEASRFRFLNTHARSCMMSSTLLLLIMQHTCYIEMLRRS